MDSLNKYYLEIINSIAWLLMDASWMMQFHFFAYLMIIPTILSGVLLIFKEDQAPGYLLALAVLSWSVMNSIWLVSETFVNIEIMFYAKFSFFIGIISLVIGMLISSRPVDFLRRFSRSSIKSIKEDS